MVKQYSRHVHFERILNFRDLGGYRTYDGHTITWRRIFRSGEMHLATERDLTYLKEEIGLRAVIDLRGSRRLKQVGIGPQSEIGIRYHNIPLTIITDEANDEIKKQHKNNVIIIREF